ncbi:uncharacterized protein LOC125247870 [Megalobrama amblycephala]|uniref:uncharacterized protein LOC125247870 n=1 Tax=Megalobrama amblycephala TaxID=75352 RepID=UPI0020141F3D|nr:uncharacterized protein LOC125247870 [Megalobrama amblycephala]
MGFVIYIKTHTGESFTLTVDSNETVKEIKRKLYGEQCDHITLFFAGRHLMDEHTLGFYNIQNGSTLNAINRMSGILYCLEEETLKGFALTSCSEEETLKGFGLTSRQLMDSYYDIRGAVTTDRGRRKKREEKKEEEREEKKGEEKVDPLPAGASSVQPDADLQFLQSLLPALKRMDIRQREHTKLKIHQLVFDAEFNAPSPPSEGMHRADSMENIPPKM